MPALGCHQALPFLTRPSFTMLFSSLRPVVRSLVVVRHVLRTALPTLMHATGSRTR
ncbi:hypothetical protein [Streptomyces sp. NRRL F-2664]|uniref:hypothetical protein n=1 Tax=Streptomyces sp. NRRL F-2664 TaxID=1463842 RepID=UPI000A67FD84|nr:hypothetical protein [Streptomyces sp. NRRL F-2664]